MIRPASVLKNPLLRLSAVGDNAAMENEPAKTEPPKRKLLWVRRLVLSAVLPVACVIWLLHAASGFAVALPVAWTATWMNGFMRGSRRAKREAVDTGIPPRDRPLPKWFRALVFILLSFCVFGWALFVGIAWGAVAGLASLYLELLAARVTIAMSEVAFNFCDKYRARNLGTAFLAQLRMMYR